MHSHGGMSPLFCRNVPLFPLLNSAAAAARRVYAAAAWVAVKYRWPVFTVKNNPRVARLFQPGAARYRVEFNIVARVDPGAALGATARVFGAHAFDHAAIPNMRAHALSYMARAFSFKFSTDSSGDGR